jgi:glutamyl-tRNA synthetase
VNYLVRLGWSHGDQEIFTLQEMIDAFTVEGINKTAAVFDQAKLEWLNAHYIKSRVPESLLPLIKPRWEAMGLPVDQRDDAWAAKVIVSLQERARTLNAMAESARFYFPVALDYDPAASKKFLTPENGALLETLSGRLAALTEWSEASLEPVFKGLAEEQGLKLGAVIQPTRVAVTGSTASPGMYEVLFLLGRELSLSRIAEAVRLASMQPQS